MAISSVLIPSNNPMEMIVSERDDLGRTTNIFATKTIKVSQIRVKPLLHKLYKFVKAFKNPVENTHMTPICKIHSRKIVLPEFLKTYNTLSH